MENVKDIKPKGEFSREKGDKIWYYHNGSLGPFYFSFDKENVYNYWPDFPWRLSKEELEIFKEENPFWYNFRLEEAEEHLKKLND